MSYSTCVVVSVVLAFTFTLFCPDITPTMPKQRKKLKDDLGQKHLKVRQVAFCRLCEKFLSDQGALEKHEKDKLHVRNLSAGFTGQVYELMTEREVAKKRESVKLRQGHILKEEPNEGFTT